MDRGREIDKSQNLNARYIDQFQNGAKTSVKTSNPPGKNLNKSFQEEKALSL
jgi:hypothetical protein